MQKPPYDVRVDNEVLRQHRDVLTNLARAAAEPISREDFFREAVVRVAEAIEIDHVKLLRYRRDKGDLLMEAGVGWHEGAVGSVAFATDMASPPGRSFQTGQPVAVENLEESTEYRASPTLKAHGIVSLLNVPILVDGATWGVLEGDSTVLRGFSRDTQEFMIAVGALIGLVIRRTHAEQAQAEAMAAAARETHRRALLLTELQHRVKNNFQTIIAMIALRKPKFPTEVGRRLVDQIAEGIMAMSLAHDQLSPTQAGEVVELATYLKALVGTIEKPHEGVLIDVEANEMQVSIDQAVPLGLIVNEAVTNAVKHAFPEGSGKIHIELLNHGRAEALLSICDNGVGVAAGAPGGSGLTLMEGLARQLRGRIEQESVPGDGTIIRTIFPRPAPTYPSVPSAKPLSL